MGVRVLLRMHARTVVVGTRREGCRVGAWARLASRVAITARGEGPTARSALLDVLRATHERLASDASRLRKSAKRLTSDRSIANHAASVSAAEVLADRVADLARQIALAWPEPGTPPEIDQGREGPEDAPVLH